MKISPEQLKAAWEAAKHLARTSILDAVGIVPDGNRKDREENAISMALLRLEAVDHTLPAIGQYMDLPLVDFTERIAVREVVRALVRREYAAYQIEQLKETL